MSQLPKILALSTLVWCGLAAAADPAPAAGTAAAPMSATQAKAANVQAAQTNALIDQVQKAQDAKDWAGEEKLLKQLMAANSDRWDFAQHLGDAQYNQGKYADAAKTYTTAITLAQADTDPTAKQALAAMYTNQGNSYLKLKKTADGVAAFGKAAALSDNPGVAYFNICATLYNQGETEGALTACDKSIAADATRADAYFIKGSILTGDGETNSNNKFLVPKGTLEALHTYLKLAPKGPHAADVQQMLQLIDGERP